MSLRATAALPLTSPNRDSAIITTGDAATLSILYERMKLQLEQTMLMKPFLSTALYQASRVPLVARGLAGACRVQQTQTMTITNTSRSTAAKPITIPMISSLLRTESIQAVFEELIID